MTYELDGFPTAEEYHMEIERLRDDNKDFFAQFTADQLAVMKERSLLSVNSARDRLNREQAVYNAIVQALADRNTIQPVEKQP